MMNFKCVFLIQLLILVVKVNAGKMFFRGRRFNDEPRKPEVLPENPVQEKWFIQPLDHFNTTDMRAWHQRYQVNVQYYKNYSNSPVYLLVEGEGPISSSWMTGGFWVESAIQHGALLFQLEHRFYGSSHPTVDTSVESLQYLTVEQAIGDIKHFIDGMKETYNLGESNKLILFGGSYAGNLVAWLRLKYPNLVYGAISSSGPVEAVVDFTDYFKVTADSLGTYSSDCVTTITEAFAKIDELSQDSSGQKNLTKTFNLCEALESSQDFETDFAQLNSILAHYISDIVQYNKVDHSSNETIDNICDILANKSMGSTSLDGFAALVKILRNSRCIEYNYQNFVNYFRSTSWNNGASSSGGRQWFFQTCHQLGYFQSSSHKPQVFGNRFPVELFIKQCTDVFGSDYNATSIAQQVQRVNNNYGGKAIASNVDRIVFVQGSIDPWYPAGVTSSSNPQSPAIFITGTAHCADTLSTDYLQDAPQLIAARQMISSYINAWLS